MVEKYTAILSYFYMILLKKKKKKSVTFGWNSITTDLYWEHDLHFIKLFSDFKCNVTTFPTVATKLMIHRKIRSKKKN